MRLIYTDEAGTSAHEPVCVVASVIVNGDKQYRSLVNEIEKTVNDLVPYEVRENYKSGFHIHATEMYSGGKNIPRSVWDFPERLDFLKAILCIPFVHDVPISLGIDAKTVDWTLKIRELYT